MGSLSCAGIGAAALTALHAGPRGVLGSGGCVAGRVVGSVASAQSGDDVPRRWRVRYRQGG